MKVIALLALFCVAMTAQSVCKLSDIEITSLKARFVDECSRSPCFSLKGVATLRNKCSEGVGVQIQITGYDKAGAPVATSELWPASVQNIPPGEYTFSVDHYLDYDPAIVRFVLKPRSLRTWR